MTWRSLPIGELCVGIFDGPHATPKKTASGPVFLGISNLAGGRLDLTALEYLSEEDYATWTRRVVPQAGDVVFSYETRIGEVAQLPAGLRCCLGRRMALMRPNPERVDGRFLLYAYLSPQFKDVLRARTVHGSTVDRLPLIDFPSFPIRVPPLSEQRSIACILGALDDRIELARKTSQTLEAMARALFKSWFVDFDPVDASTDRRRREGNDQAIASIFPDGFDETDHGAVPRGWKFGPASELQAHTRYSCVAGPFGSNLTSKDYVEAGVPVIRGSNLGGPHVWLDDARFAFVSEEKADALTGNLAFPGDVVFTQRGTLGQVAVIPADIPHRRFVLSQSQMKMTVDPARGSAIFVAMYFQQPRVVDFIIGNGQQAGVPHVNLAFLREFKMLLPPPQVLRAFDERVRPLFDAIRHQARMSETLTAVRDALLPELMSGALRVPAGPSGATHAS